MVWLLGWPIVVVHHYDHNDSGQYDDYGSGVEYHHYLFWWYGGALGSVWRTRLDGSYRVCERIHLHVRERVVFPVPVNEFLSWLKLSTWIGNVPFGQFQSDMASLQTNRLASGLEQLMKRLCEFLHLHGLCISCICFNVAPVSRYLICVE